MTSGFPLISVIMPVAASHQRYIPAAIKCYESQTWPNKELLVTGDTWAIFKALECISKDERGYGLTHDPGWTLGHLRNYLCKHASGDFIAHFDVDDYSAPTRLEAQVKAIVQPDLRASVIGFRDCLFWDERTSIAWRYSGGHYTNIGASLLYDRCWWKDHPFSDKTLNEDRDFVREAQRSKVWASMPGAELLIARNHTDNTSPRPKDPEPATIADGQWTRLDATVLPERFPR